MQNPVIVVGMARSGTTLISEMLHQAGTSMFAEGMNPEYDGGNKYERVSCQDINLEILGVKSVPAISTIWEKPLRDISDSSLEALNAEVGSEPWGFKDPRTTITYAAWRKVFPKGPTIYTYRHHGEVMRHYFRTAKNPTSQVRRTRRALRAWIFCHLPTCACLISSASSSVVVSGRFLTIASAIRRAKPVGSSP